MVIDDVGLIVVVQLLVAASGEDRAKEVALCKDVLRRSNLHHIPLVCKREHSGRLFVEDKFNRSSSLPLVVFGAVGSIYHKSHLFAEVLVGAHSKLESSALQIVEAEELEARAKANILGLKVACGYCLYNGVDVFVERSLLYGIHHIIYAKFPLAQLVRACRLPISRVVVHNIRAVYYLASGGFYLLREIACKVRLAIVYLPSSKE